MASRIVRSKLTNLADWSYYVPSTVSRYLPERTVLKRTDTRGVGISSMRKYTVRVKKQLSIPPCLTTVDIVWSRPLCDRCRTVVWPLHDRCVTVAWPLCDRCVSVAEPSLNHSISAVGLYKRGVRRYTIIASAAAASHTYKRYCGIGTLYFKILTMVTAIIWQPGHWPQGYLRTSSDWRANRVRATDGGV